LFVDKFEHGLEDPELDIDFARYDSYSVLTLAACPVSVNVIH